MTQAVAHILEEAGQLSVAERADLADRLVESLVADVPPDIKTAQLTEVCRRIAQVESGEMTLIPGDEVMTQIRRLVRSARAAS